jgi:hypothetical protein
VAVALKTSVTSMNQRYGRIERDMTLLLLQGLLNDHTLDA